MKNNTPDTIFPDKFPDTFPNPNNYAGFLLWQKANKWENYVNNILKKHELIQSEHLMLISLAWLENTHHPVTQTKLASYTGTKAMHVSKVLKKFQKSLLITKSEGKDTRSKVIQLTPKARDLLISTASEMSKLDEAFFDFDGKKDFIEYLKKI
jgi:DNA-binding MarR family transcriptional regulator